MSTRDVVLVLDHFRPERHAVTQLYNKHFLGVVYIVDANGWPGCLKIRPAQWVSGSIYYPGEIMLGARITIFQFVENKCSKGLPRLCTGGPLIRRWTADPGTAVTPPG